MQRAGRVYRRQLQPCSVAGHVRYGRPARRQGARVVVAQGIRAVASPHLVCKDERRPPARVKLLLVPGRRVSAPVKCEQQRRGGRAAGEHHALVKDCRDPDRVARPVRRALWLGLRDADHARLDGVDPDGARGAEQPPPVWRRQPEDGVVVAVRVPDRPAVEVQCAAVCVAQAVGAVAWLHRIAERDLGIAADAGHVLGAPWRVGREPEKRGARHGHRLGKGHGDVDRRSGRVRAGRVRRADRLGDGRRVYGYAPPVPERSPLSRSGQLEVDGSGGARRRAVLPNDAARHQGARPRVVQAAARVVARAHRVVEHERVRPAAGQVLGGPAAPAKVEQ